MNAVGPQHPRQIELRRLLAGEQVETAAAHVSGCADCKARLRELEELQRKFEADIPFERFAAGVDRATRQPRATPTAARRPIQWALAIAATVLLLAGVPLLVGGGEEGANRLKGGSGIELKVKGVGPQRSASVEPLLPEALAPNEKVMLGFRAGGYRYVAAISIDEAGQVTALYPQRGPSLPAPTASSTQYLSESFEFTGTGLERVIVVLTNEPIDVDELGRAAKTRYDEARGNLSQLGTLDLPGEQFHRTFLKP